MSEILLACLAIAVLVAGVIVLAVLVCRLADWGLLPPSPTTEETAQAQAEHLQRLRNPKFDELAKLYAAPIPRTLKELYECTDLLTRENFELVDTRRNARDGDSFVRTFLPADGRTVSEAWFEEWNDRFPFADDGFGNYYWIPIKSDSGDDPPVWFTDHDGGETWQVADTLSSFLARPIRRDVVC
jgi:hypothetical protein